MRGKSVRIALARHRHKHTASQFIFCLPHQIAIRSVDKKKPPFRAELYDQVLLALKQVREKRLDQVPCRPSKVIRYSPGVKRAVIIPEKRSAVDY